jgi:aspartyl-tRNA(Asn)/glutamyl-tRNA(Gln) amidotransferase subunit A
MESMSASIPLTLLEAITRVRAGALSGKDLWRECTRRIEELNPRLNAFITPMGPEAHLAAGMRGGPDNAQPSLAGAPIAVKDLYETAGVRTTAGSLFFKDYLPEADAAAVSRVRAAGGEIIGKTNTHEIALGVTTENPHFGVCRNPWNPDHVPGGSSGGSAVAVATGMALAALGTDTGGSIRIPASLCGVVGLKPTYGRVSLRGVFPLSWNLDHAGPLTRTAADAALMLQVLAGYDADDAQCANVAVDDYLRHIDEGVQGWRIADAGGAYLDDCDPEVLDAVAAAVQVLESSGARIQGVDVSFLREAALANGLMTQADAAAYHRQRLAEHPERFGSDVRQRLEVGRDTTTSDYVLARRTQAQMRRRMARLFEDFEVLVLPTTPLTAPPIGSKDAVARARQLTRFTAPFNLTGVPAISLPCGFSKDGLPIGLQLVAAEWQEARLLQTAAAYERQTDWTSQFPKVV